MIFANHKKHTIWALCGIFTIALVWFLLPTGAPQTGSPLLASGPKVKTIQLVKDSYRPEIDLLGRVKAKDNAVLKSQVQGEIVDFYVKPGEIVKKDTLLASINAEDYQTTLDREEARFHEIAKGIERIHAQLKSAKINLKYSFNDRELAESDYQRFFKLRKKGFGDQKTLDISKQTLLRSKTDWETRQFEVDSLTLQIKESEAQLVQQETQVRQAAINLSRTQIKAPYDGIVTEKNVSQGDFVTVGTPILRLMNPYELLITATLSYEEASKIGKEAVSLSLVELPKHNDLDISLIGVTGLENAAAEVHFSLSQKYLNLNNGEGITVRLRLPEVENSYWIPESALFARNYIYAVEDDNKLKAYLIVLIGHATKNQQKGYLIQMTDDLNGHSILATPLPRVADGMLVEPSDT